MRNSKEVFSEIISAIKIQESKEERESIARLIMEHFFQLDLTNIVANIPVDLPAHRLENLKQSISRINGGEPVQYVLQQADFYGRNFFVNRDVLIPRPETEELVIEIINSIRQYKNTNGVRIVDVGTGSGCIPVTLALNFPSAEIFATDVSTGALHVAKKNAKQFGATVQFLQHDILTEKLPFTSIDFLVSNPPYIGISEQKQMNANVLQFEPHLALFVPDENPLLFYEKISRQGRTILAPGGVVLFEINEKYGTRIMDLLLGLGFSDVIIKKDLSGKQRIVKATQPK